MQTQINPSIGLIDSFNPTNRPISDEPLKTSFALENCIHYPGSKPQSGAGCHRRVTSTTPQKPFAVRNVCLIFISIYIHFPFCTMIYGPGQRCVALRYCVFPTYRRWWLNFEPCSPFQTFDRWASVFSGFHGFIGGHPGLEMDSSADMQPHLRHTSTGLTLLKMGNFVAKCRNSHYRWSLHGPQIEIDDYL